MTAWQTPIWNSGELIRLLQSTNASPLRIRITQYHLGQAYQRKGQRDQARVAYQRFLEFWKDADTDLPEVINARKALGAAE